MPESHTLSQPGTAFPFGVPAQSSQSSPLLPAATQPQSEAHESPPHTPAQSLPIPSAPVPTKLVSQFPAQSATEPLLQSQPVLHVFELAVVSVP